MQYEIKWREYKGGWEARIELPAVEYDKHGKPKRNRKIFSGKNKKVLCERAMQFIDAYKAGQIESVKNKKLGYILTFYTEYEKNEGNHSEGTIKNHECLIRKYIVQLQEVSLDKLTPDLARNWFRNLLNSNVSYHRINDVLKLLKAAFNYAIEEGKATVNPFSKIRSLKIDKVHRNRFSRQQLIKLFESCLELMPEFFCIFVVAVMTGMRVGEYSALTVADVNFELNEIRVNKQYTRGKLYTRLKTQESSRTVHPSRTVLQVIMWHMNEYGITEGFLFKDAVGNPISSKWMSRKFKKLLECNGFEEDFMRVHDLRGQYIDMRHASGISTEYTANEVGHSNTSTTSNIYTELLLEVHEEANKMMENWLFGKTNILADISQINTQNDTERSM